MIDASLYPLQATRMIPCFPPLLDSNKCWWQCLLWRRPREMSAVFAWHCSRVLEATLGTAPHALSFLLLSLVLSLYSSIYLQLMAFAGSHLDSFCFDWLRGWSSSSTSSLFIMAILFLHLSFFFKSLLSRIAFSNRFLESLSRIAFSNWFLQGYCRVVVDRYRHVCYHLNTQLRRFRNYF